MAIICEKCGKEVRTGAKFCGSCGEPQEAVQVPPSTETDQVACPHCGKPIRKDAKFCPSCGQSIPELSAAATTDTPQPPPEPSSSDDLTPPPPPPGVEPISAPPPEKSFFSRYWWLFLLIFILCLVILLLGYILAKDDRINIPGFSPETDTPTPTYTSTIIIYTQVPSTNQPTISETLTSTVTATHTPEPSATEEQPTESGPTEETTTIEPTKPPEPTETTEPDPTASPEDVFKEGFEDPLETNWEIWGNPPLPEIIGIGRNAALKLDSEARITGVTTNENIAVSPPFNITFEAALDEISQDDTLVFDWQQEINGNQAQDPGLVQVLIENGKAEMIITRPDPDCSTQIDDINYHNYHIRFDIGSIVTFIVDEQEICNLSLEGINIGNGKLTFSGRGWVDEILVAQIR